MRNLTQKHNESPEVEVWENNTKKNGDCNEDDDGGNSGASTNILYAQQRLIRWYAIMMLTFQSLFSLSDSALNYLLSFLAAFMLIPGRCLFAPMKPFARYIPFSVFRARRMLRCQKDHFQIYAVCPKCSTIYETWLCHSQCRWYTETFKLCTRIEYPCHPWESYRSECNATIMKPIRS